MINKRRKENDKNTNENEQNWLKKTCQRHV
jgi:hypothetical protein